MLTDAVTLSLLQTLCHTSPREQFCLQVVIMIWGDVKQKTFAYHVFVTFDYHVVVVIVLYWQLVRKIKSPNLMWKSYHNRLQEKQHPSPGFRARRGLLFTHSDYVIWFQAKKIPEYLSFPQWARITIQNILKQHPYDYEQLAKTFFNLTETRCEKKRITDFNVLMRTVRHFLVSKCQCLVECKKTKVV